MLRHLAACSFAALLSWSGNCAAQTADPGPVRVGDRWSYDIKDSATGDLRQAYTLVVFEVNDKEIIGRGTIKGYETRPQTVVYDLNWGAIDNGTWKYRPSELPIRTPLHVGKEWRLEFNSQNMKDGNGWHV